MIRPLPDPPSRDKPGPFAAQADALLAALPGFVADANALEQSLIFVGTTGQSSTALAVGSGVKTLTASTGKAWVVGAWVHLVSAGGIGNVMVGQVQSYNVDTGALQVNVGAFSGSGTHSDWLIGLSSPQAPITAALLAAGAVADNLGYVPVSPTDLTNQVATSFASVPGKNRVINGTFAVNQRAFAGGSRTSAQYGHDRWKAGSGGATYTVTGETATITVGTLQQVIEGVNVPEGGTYTLSWSGTAQARVDGGSYAASPITVTGKTAGSNITIEFGTGTVTKVQFEAGSTPTTYERRGYSQELAACQRYYLAMTGRVIGVAGVAGSSAQYAYAPLAFPVEMRAAPTVNYALSGNANVSTAAPQDSSKWGCSLVINAASAGQFSINFTTLSFDAEL